MFAFKGGGEQSLWAEAYAVIRGGIHTLCLSTAFLLEALSAHHRRYLIWYLLYPHNITTRLARSTANSLCSTSEKGRPGAAAGLSLRSTANRSKVRRSQGKSKYTPGLSWVDVSLGHTRCAGGGKKLWWGKKDVSWKAPVCEQEGWDIRDGCFNIYGSLCVLTR